MNALKAAIPTMGLAGALMGMASNLLAQDLAGRWYLGVDAGLALQQDLTIEDTSQPSWFHDPLPRKASFDPGVRLDVSGGVHLSQSWKAEIDLGFIYNSGGTLDYFQAPLMGNVIYTLPLHGPISAYAGAGVGGVADMLWNGFFGSEGGFAFGYQGILGVKYAMNDSLDLGLTYKLLGTIEHDVGAATVDGTLSHSILAAFIFKF